MLKNVEGYEDWMDKFITKEIRHVGGDTITLYTVWDETQANILRVTSNKQEAVKCLKGYSTYVRECGWRRDINNAKGFLRIVNDFKEDLEESIMKVLRGDPEMAEKVDILSLSIENYKEQIAHITFTDK